MVSPLVPILGSGDFFRGEVGVEKVCSPHPSQLGLSPATGSTTLLVSHMEAGIEPWSSLNRWLSGKESSCSAGDKGEVRSIPGLGRSPEGNSNPFQSSCLGNPMDRGAWQLQSTGLQRVRHNCATKHTDQSKPEFSIQQRVKE